MMSLHSWKLNRASDESLQDAQASCAEVPGCAALGNRALNVLKELHLELTGTCPPKGNWCPPDDFLRRLSASQLATARNCGPRTRREIVAFARARGVVIESLSCSGKSLSAVWQDLASEAVERWLTKAEITSVLERSIRRRSARIPVAFQVVLLKILSSTYE